jgi:hypothetical protein
MHEESALHRVNQGPLDLIAIQPKDHDLDRLLGLTDALYQPVHAITGLDDEFHLPAIPRCLDAELRACVRSLAIPSFPRHLGLPLISAATGSKATHNATRRQKPATLL